MNDPAAPEQAPPTNPSASVESDTADVEEVGIDDTDLEITQTASAGPVADGPDLDAIDRDLAGVEHALGRLADGTYWTDEITGEPIDSAVLDADPTARRSPA